MRKVVWIGCMFGAWFVAAPLVAAKFASDRANKVLDTLGYKGTK